MTANGTVPLTSLDKAKAAMQAAKDLVESTPVDHTGNLPLDVDLEFSRLMRAADANAAIALVEAVDRLTQVLEHHR